MVDIEKLKKYAKDIRENIKLIKEFVNVPENEFLKDKKAIFSTRYLLVECIEACAHICNHILVKKGKIIPAGYVECFKGLHEIGVFDKEFTETLIKMVGFRNILIHQYFKVDDRKVYQYAKNNLDDFEKFLKGVGKFLKEEI